MEGRPINTNEKLLFGGILVATVIITVLVVTFTLRIPSTGKIKAIGLAVYKDAGATEPLTAIDWGVLGPGDSAVASCFIKSLSNMNVNVTMRTENWNPTAAAQYISITWDYPADRALAPGELIKVTFTLKVSSAITGITNFASDLVLTVVG